MSNERSETNCQVLAIPLGLLYYKEKVYGVHVHVNDGDIGQLFVGLVFNCWSDVDPNSALSPLESDWDSYPSWCAIIDDLPEDMPITAKEQLAIILEIVIQISVPELRGILAELVEEFPDGNS